MYKIIIFIVFIGVIVNAKSDETLSFYKDALENLQYNETYKLYKKSNYLSVEAKKISRFANLNADVVYGFTKAKLLNSFFNNTDVSLSDTIDLFGKSSDDISLLGLQLQQNHILLELQKEQLFISLIEMITAYEKTNAVLKQHQKIYKKQDTFKNRLYLAVEAGGKPKIEYERFTNILSLFKNQIIEEENALDTMRESLKLYAPNSDIPKLQRVTLNANQDEFINNNLQLKYNDLEAKVGLANSEKMKRNWLPDVVLGVTQQFNNDPTANGNNYTLNAGLHIAYDGGNLKSIESSRVNMLIVKSQRKDIAILQKIKFLTMHRAYSSSKNAMEVLSTALSSSKKNLDVVKEAYLRQYTDLSTYIQTIKEFTSIQEAYYNAKYKNIKNALILNNLSKGTIYE